MTLTTKYFLSLFLSLTFISSASAYIPKLPTILDKAVAKNGGKKALIMERTVTFKNEDLSCKETWYIAHADLMKVVVTNTNSSEPWSFEILYKDGKRHTLSTSGNIKSFALSAEFYEPLLHFRSSKAFMDRLIRFQMLPTWSPRLFAEKDAPPQDSFIKLDRFKGAVSYSIGSSGNKNTGQPPQLWLQQDSFNIQKLRLGSQVEVEFNDYRDHDESDNKELSLPEIQTLFWKQSTVQIQTTSIKIVDNKDVAKYLKIEKGTKAKLPEQVAFKEFYSRFR